MIEINVNFVFFEKLQDQPKDDGDVARIVVIRECKDPDAALEDSSSGSFPL
ncbi:MAG TPA: hypothetical protein VEI73_12335 [Candidatus Acidoferrum sp.]|nr:hypothetical protein [Candidatus Acidoferrum sp.]